MTIVKLSTKGRYGVKAMFDLAEHFGDGPVALKGIAERQGISEHYLEQLMAVLRKAGLVKSIRGAQGGYVLAREPANITVGDIIRVLEGPLAPTECVSEEEPEKCKNAPTCITRTIWQKMRDSLAEVIDSITLADMVRDAEKIKAQNNLMYYI